MEEESLLWKVAVLSCWKYCFIMAVGAELKSSFGFKEWQHMEDNWSLIC